MVELRSRRWFLGLTAAFGGVVAACRSRQAAPASAPRALVAAGDTLPLGQLAERLACVKSNVTQLVERLEAEGLVSRASDPNDRRSRLAAITDAGRRAYEQGLRVQREAADDLLRALSSDEAAQLSHLIGKLGTRCG